MDVRKKMLGLAVTAMSLCGVQSASAQQVENSYKKANSTEQVSSTSFDADKALAKFLGKRLKVTEYWINSANDTHYDKDSRYVVFSTALGAFIGNKAGNGYFVKSTGDVFYADNGKVSEKVSPEDAKLVNSLYAMTGGGVKNEKAGGKPIRQVQDGLKLCVTKEEDKLTGDNMKVVWVAGLAGNRYLSEPSDGEMSAAASMAFYEKLENQNICILSLYNKWRQSMEEKNFALSQKEGGLTPEERGVICVKNDERVKKAYLASAIMQND